MSCSFFQFPELAEVSFKSEVTFSIFQASDRKVNLGRKLCISFLISASVVTFFGDFFFSFYLFVLSCLQLAQPAVVLP